MMVFRQPPPAKSGLQPQPLDPTRRVEALRRLLAEDNLEPTPVITSVSLSAWARIKTGLAKAPSGSLRPSRPFIIGLAGGSGSGKTQVRDVLADALSQFAPVSTFTQDNYYCDFSQRYAGLTPQAFYDTVDLDDPEQVLTAKLIADLRTLRAMPLGAAMTMPRLVYGTPTTLPSLAPTGQLISAEPFVITEGIHALGTPALRRCYDLSIYVDVDEAVRRDRWLLRNQKENRGATCHMWQTTVQCMGRYVLPSRAQADVVVNNTADLSQLAQMLYQLTGLLLAD
ncbi:MAG: hypothetical protein KC475_03620 [Cyanobacteria bacterium HKST-UBA03]|nr:hypothetical protein [Cyanobacteria bacterium HKST-UBA03]